MSLFPRRDIGSNSATQLGREDVEPDFAFAERPARAKSLGGLDDATFLGGWLAVA